MTNESIAIFLALASNRSFSTAALHLGMTKQMVSKAMQSLEEDLDVQLFLRDKRTVELTAAGEMYRDFFRKQSIELGRKTHRLGRDSEPDRVYLAVDEWLDFSPEMERAVEAFEEQTGVSVRIYYVGEGRGMAYLMSGKADALIASQYTVRRFENFCELRPFAELELRVQTNPRYPLVASDIFLTAGEVTVLTSFAGENSPEEAARREELLCARCGLHPKRIEVMPNLATAKLNVVLENGVVIMPARPVSDELVQVPTGQTATAVLLRLKNWEGTDLAPLLEQLRAAFERKAAL